MNSIEYSTCPCAYNKAKRAWEEFLTCEVFVQRLRTSVTACTEELNNKSTNWRICVFCCCDFSLYPLLFFFLTLDVSFDKGIKIKSFIKEGKNIVFNVSQILYIAFIELAREYSILCVCHRQLCVPVQSSGLEGAWMFFCIAIMCPSTTMCVSLCVSKCGRVQRKGTPAPLFQAIKFRQH